MDTLLDRFCRYVKVETTAVEETDKYPSSEGQLELGKILAAEMEDLGLVEIQHPVLLPMGYIREIMPYHY